MRNRICWLFATVAAFIAAAAPLSAQGSSSKLYGITFFGNQLVSIDEQTGESIVIGQLSNSISPYGIAARYGRLYAFDQIKGQIAEINPSTAQVNRFIPIGVQSIQGEGDLAFRADGLGFVASALNSAGFPVNDLYSFDVLAGTSTRIGTTAVTIDAMAFGPNNILYALGQGEGKLYTIDQKNGTTTEVGSLGIDMNSPFAALAFSPAGQLYASIDDRLYKINAATGAALPVSTNVLDLGVSSVSGLAYQVPEPGLQLYGLTFFSNQLISIDPTTGEASLIGTAETKLSGYGLATLNKKLFSFSSDSDHLVQINTVNGNVAGMLGSLPFGDVQGEGDIAIRSDGVGFVASALSTNAEPINALYRFDIESNATRLVTNTFLTLDALAFDQSNELYALAQGEGKLFKVDQITGALTEVGSLGVDMNSPFAAMTFAPDGTLFAAIDDRLYTINPTTGQASFVAQDVLDFGFSSVAGLAFAPAPARVSIVREGNSIVVFWSGLDSTLEVSADVTGPWKAATLQSEPQRFALTDQRSFFRLRQ